MKKADLLELKRLFEKADVPTDLRVDKDYLDYGHDAITRPSVTRLHRVYVTKANEVEMTTECAEFICYACNKMPEIIKFLEGAV